MRCDILIFIVECYLQTAFSLLLPQSINFQFQLLDLFRVFADDCFARLDDLSIESGGNRFGHQGLFHSFLQLSEQ